MYRHDPLKNLVLCVTAASDSGLPGRLKTQFKSTKQFNMIRKYFPFCFYVLVSVLCLGKLSQAYPAGNLGGGGVIPGVTSTSETDYKTIDSITPLKIGDKIPEELWEMTFSVVSANNDDVQHLKLGDYRDKLIILDFWATWCAPCISSLHKLDTLQQEFADDLLVFPTSYEVQDKVRKFFTDKGWSLPTAFEETQLKKYFPHRSIPHQVWIKDGEVMAMPPSAYANSKIIASVINGNEEKFVVRVPLGDRDIPLPPLYESKLTFRDATATGGSSISPEAVTISNVSIPTLFIEAFQNEIGFSGRKNRVIIDVSENVRPKLKLDQPVRVTGSYEQDVEARKFRDENMYSYYLKVGRPTDRATIIEYMKQDIQNIFKNYLKIEARTEIRSIPCLVLKKSNIHGLDTPTEVSQEMNVRDRSLTELTRMLAYRNWRLPTPIVNGVDESDDTLISLASDLRDIPSVVEELNKWGYTLEEELREIKVLVIADAFIPKKQSK